MGRIDVILPDDLEEQFRREVANRKGMRKGNLKDALKEAIVLWMRKEP